MADARIHAANKHPKKTFEQLFPEDESEEEEEDDELPDSKNVFKCAFTKDEMFSDGYTMKPIFEGNVMEVKAQDANIGGSIVINLVH